MDKGKIDIYKEEYKFKKESLIFEIKKLCPNLMIDDKSILINKYLDIYIPDKNFAIEIHNNHWHSEAILSSNGARHKQIDKTNKCKDKDIRLFHIFENDWINRKTQIISFLKSALNCNETKVYGRDCDIAEDVCEDIFDDNHIQGYAKNTIKSFGLIHNGEVIGAMSASKHHRQNVKENCIILNRLVFKSGFSIAGGSSKLFNKFLEWAKFENYNEILSWSDTTITDGGIYKTLEFSFVDESDPDYFYWDINKNEYKTKQSQKKSENGCPKDITEREWCQKNGLYRIYNCGKKLWSYNLKNCNLENAIDVQEE